MMAAGTAVLRNAANAWWDCEGWVLRAQTELSRNKCRPQRIDIWQQAVDTDVFNPAFRSAEMRVRMSGGNPDAVILTYVGRLGAGKRCTASESFLGIVERFQSSKSKILFLSHARVPLHRIHDSAVGAWAAPLGRPVKPPPQYIM